MRFLLLAGLSALLHACSSAPTGEEPRTASSSPTNCTPERLGELAATVEQVGGYLAGQTAVRGVARNCSDQVPEPYRGLFTDGVSVASQRKLLRDPNAKRLALEEGTCPNYENILSTMAGFVDPPVAAIVWKHCALQRHAVLPGPEELSDMSTLMPWVMSDWLDARGVEPDGRAILTRALLAYERELFGPFAGVAKPELVTGFRGGRITASEPIVVISNNSIVFEGEVVAQVLQESGQIAAANRQDGHFVPALHAPIEARRQQLRARDESIEFDAPLHLAADASTPFSTIVDVLYTAGKAGYTLYGFVVEPEPWVLQSLLVSPPIFYASGLKPPQQTAVLAFISHEGIRLRPRVGQELRAPFSFEPLKEGEEAPWLQESEVEAAAVVLAALYPGAKSVVVTAEGTVRYDTLVKTVANLRGPNCSLAARSGCHFTNFIIEAGADISTHHAPKDAVEPKAQVRGALDKDIIRRIVRAHISEVRECYNQGLKRTPTLAGRVMVQFVITPNGSVDKPLVVPGKTTLDDEAVAGCIASAVGDWKFPKPRGGGNVIVSYPFTLTPG